jgi:PD-(D/E)XK nuclease superfamily
MSSSEEEQKLLELIKDLEQFSREVRFPSGLNIFEAAGMHLQEIRHSNFLAFLLRPQEPHGLGAEFLRRLALKAIDASSIDPPPIKPITVALADFSDVLVSREHRNIDLLVQSKVDNLVFVIENKLESSESEYQLSKYEEIISSEFPKSDKLFAYLTKDGHPPSNPLWSAIDYSDVVDALQEARFHLQSSVTDDAKVLVDHYIELIRRNIVPDEVLKEQCRKLYLKHKNALDLIFRYGEVNAFESAANQFFDTHKELKRWTSRTSTAAFLPISLLEVIPEIEGINWWGQSRPIVYWFNLQPGNLVLSWRLVLSQVRHSAAKLWSRSCWIISKSTRKSTRSTREFTVRTGN